ncbi:hypothetical protein ACMGDK_19495 [Chryseobacterium sp. DT-3]|uniref:hypothetical protein n=1 Tax=Chryseobacterium sp. DT-3 TaxID=3396164 RepID=UPI003F1BF957
MQPQPQDFADMLGWVELSKKVDDAYLEMPDSTNTLVLCDNWSCGAINYYSKCDIRAVSLSADYINWFNFDTEYQNLIRVTTS